MQMMAHQGGRSRGLFKRASVAGSSSACNIVLVRLFNRAPYRHAVPPIMAPLLAVASAAVILIIPRGGGGGWGNKEVYWMHGGGGGHAD